MKKLFTMLIAAFGFLLGAQAQTDLALTSIDTMSSGCGLTTQIVRVNFSNVGSTVINSPAVSYRVNGGAAVNGTIAGAIPVGGTGSFNFPAAYVFPSTGTFVFEAWVRATGDNNTLNDTAFRTVVNLSSKTGGDTLRFDTNPSLATGGTNNSWAHGAPSGPVISTAPSSPNIWVTNLSGDYNSNEDSWIQTGCYDLSGLSQPMVRFDLNYRTENSYDGAILEASTDGGSTWATVGAQGSGSNWYNGSLTRTYYTGPIWMNNSNGWVRAQHNLSGLTSLTQVIFRFHFYSDGSVEEDGVGIDNFEIYDSASLLQPNDVGVAYFEKPISGCGLSASDTVVVWVQNFGTSNQSNVSVAYSMNGGAPVNATIPGIIPAGTSVRYAFATRVNVSAGGSYNFVGYTSLANDLLRFNDTARATVVNNTVSSFPYLENFESGTSGSGFAQGTFPNGWSVTTKNSGFPFSWYLFSGSTGSFATGPTVDHTFGTAAGKYSYTEASNGIQDDTTILTTPCFNLTSLTNPTLEFWFHRVGASIGTMVVEYDDNGTWTYLDSLAGQFQTAETDPWQRRTATLPASLNNTKLRFIGIRGVGFDGDMAIDDVRVFDSLLLNNDVGISAVLKPTGSGCGAVTDSVVVTVYNFGLTAQSNIPVSYVFNGGAPVNAIVAGSIPAQSSRRYAFSTLVTATSGSTNTVVAYTTLTNDGQRANDTARGTFTRLYSITGADTQTFDPRPSLWTIGGANTTWAEGAPTASVQNSPVSAPNVIATNLSGDYNSNEDSWIQTSCYNLAGMTQPMVKFDLNYETENNYDGVILESSTDGGATWATVGAQGSGTNWYNGALTRTYYTGPLWMNSSGGWVNVEHSLSGITNLSNVIFRFHFFSDGSVVRNGINIDNFSVYDSAILNQPNDVGISRIVKPITGCGLSAADSVVVLVRNSGTSAQSNVSVGYIFNGGAPVLGTVPGTLAPGAIVRYAFTSTVNVATGGNYSLVAFTRLATDQLRFNDTLRATITNSIINTFPHFQDFETSVSGNGTTIGTLPAGWNVDNSGRTGFPFSWQAFAGSTSSTATGPTVDHTTGTATGKYIYTEASNGLTNDSTALVTPCMNMSALNRPAMSFWYHKVGATMGDMFIEYDNNGTWTLLDTILGQTHSAEADPWLQKTIVFPGRVTNTKIRFIGVRGTSFTGDMAIDDVRFFDSTNVVNDIGVSAIIQPSGKYCGQLFDSVVVNVSNFGISNQSNVQVSYSLNGGPAVNAIIPGVITARSVVQFTFPNPISILSSSNNTLLVYTSIANDLLPNNDTIRNSFSVHALPATPLITASGSTTFCQGESVQLVSSANGTWSNGPTADSISVTSAGSYTVLVRDTNGCTATSAPVNVTVNALPTTPLITAVGATTFCSGDSVQLVSSANGTWSNGATGVSISVTAAGAYTVLVRDTNGCTATSAPVNVTVNALPTTPVITAAGATTFCQGGSVQLNSSATGTWSNGVAGDSISATTSGAYTVLVRDTNGCTATSAPVNVTVNALPTAPVISGSRSLNLCFGDTIVLTANGPGVWSTGDTTLSITTSTAGSFSYTVTDSNGCSNNSSAVVVVNALPTTPVITAAGATTFCQGGSVQLNSSATGTWSNGVAGDSISATTSGAYTVLVRDTNGCTATSAPVNVTVNALPTAPVISGSRSLNLCFGDTIVLTANGPGVWSTGDTTLSITTSTAGSFNYTVTDSNGCRNNSSAVVVVNALPATPVITAAGSTTICAGDTVRLTSSASGTWSNGFVGSVLPVTATGSFFVVVTDSNGCRSGSLNTNVTVNPVPAKPVITANRDTLTSSSVSGNQWFNVTTGSVAGATNQKLVIPVTGRYFAVVTQNGCSSVPSDTLFVIKLGAGTLAQTEVRVYPNPTSGQVYVALPAGATQEVMVRVMDASGRVVRTAQLSNNQNAVEFDLSGMSSGLYFVHLSQGNEVKTVKLMVK